MAPTTKETVVPVATAPPIPVDVVGNAFVQQYYKILHESPDEVYKFYKENSRLARPSAAAGGGTDSVTTLEAIKNKILETSMSTATMEIDSVDSHALAGGGVLVLVKGRHSTILCLRGQSCAFSQSFLLAPQVGGYYLMRDTFRYVDGESSAAPGHGAAAV